MSLAFTDFCKAATRSRLFHLAALLLVMFLAAAAAGCGDIPDGETKSETGSAVRDAEARVIFLPAREGSAEPLATLAVEVARTPQQRARGLMDRAEMAPDRGMIFVYDSEVASSFWMKNTYIPLSIAYISRDGVIVDMQDMAPLSEKLHSPARSYMFAVEVNQGYFGEHGIEVGDRAQFEGI